MRRARGQGATVGLIALVAVGVLALPACSDRADLAEDAPPDRVADDVPLPVWSVPYAVRGRLLSPDDVSYRCDATDSRVPRDVFEDTVARALAAWNDTGLVGFRPARDGEEADVTFSWGSATHGSCPVPFGVDFSVAHTGPVGPGNFVHLDAGHRWSAEGGRGESLLVVAAHEAGHVLGLDHSPDPTALMYADTTRSAPTPSDLAGLHALYGGGEDRADDLAIFAAGGGEPRTAAHALRRVAPAEYTDWATFDTDGDGGDEVIVWRTDPAGVGTMTMYHFDAGPALARTIGPLLGVAPSGARPSFVADDDGRRWILSREHDGTPVVRLYDDRGWIRPVTSEERRHAPAYDATSPAAGETTCDLDGDGVSEVVTRGPAGPGDG
ncbi:MAG: matrixin family metalloprotease [Planctomycetota bacterium]